MFKKIALLLLFALAVFAVIVMRQPDDFRISRSASISGPSAKVFDQVNDLHRWDAWSPWVKLDPNAKNSFAGPVSGVGASLSWSGNEQVGEGTMTIIESRPAELVKFRLEFLKPFVATNTAEFSFAPEGDHTRVTWSMYGHNNFLAKALSLFMDCDKMVGEQFEKGLAQLNVVVQGLPQ